MLASICACAGEWKVLRFFEDGASLSGVLAAEATARCINFIDRSRDEAPFGVSGAAMVRNQRCCGCYPNLTVVWTLISPEM